MSVPHLEIREDVESGWVRLRLAGELDLASGPQLRERLSQLARGHSPVRLDLSSLDFIDSSGLQVLVRAIREAESNGWALRIDRETTPQVARLLELVHLDELIPGFCSGQGADLAPRLRVRA